MLAGHPISLDMGMMATLRQILSMLQSMSAMAMGITTSVKAARILSSSLSLLPSSPGPEREALPGNRGIILALVAAQIRKSGGHSYPII
jgi:hypothetical protein